MAAFTCWIPLLITQTALVAAGRVDIHRRLGIAGFLLVCAMVVLGVLAATDSLVGEAGPVGRDPKFFYIIPLSNIFIFAVLTFFAFRARFKPAAHKRLILIATMGLLVAAIARWPFALVHKRAAVAAPCSYIFLVFMVAYDLWSTRKIHRATLWRELS
jgi:FtsH-binding integral membrane protein